MAVIMHGHNRLTEDFDVWIAISPENGERASQAIHDFIGETKPPAEFVKPGFMLRFGHPPTRFEILSKISGVDYEECRERAIEVDLGDVKTRMISLRDLRKNKASTERPKDAIDLDHLPDPDDPESMAHFGDNPPR